MGFPKAPANLFTHFSLSPAISPPTRKPPWLLMVEPRRFFSFFFLPGHSFFFSPPSCVHYGGFRSGLCLSFVLFWARSSWANSLSLFPPNWGTLFSSFSLFFLQFFGPLKATLASKDTEIQELKTKLAVSHAPTPLLLLKIVLRPRESVCMTTLSRMREGDFGERIPWTFWIIFSFSIFRFLKKNFFSYFHFLYTLDYRFLRPL